MPDDTNDTPADSPKDIATGPVKTPPGPGTETGEAAGGTVPPKPEDATPADRRNSAFGGESEGADHETEEAAAYRENDA